MTEERREEERINVSLNVRWAGATGADTSRLSDIGLGGCFIDTLGQVTLGELIDLAIQLPNEEWLPLRGEVAFYQPNIGFSVCFTFITEDEQEALERLMNQ
jgi:Tfp pilus assembly protein PilZ